MGQAPAALDVTVASGMAIYYTSGNHADYFTGATLDGTPLSDPANFTGEDGSIILHMNQSYLNTLSPEPFAACKYLRGYLQKRYRLRARRGRDVPTTGHTATPWYGRHFPSFPDGLIV